MNNLVSYFGLVDAKIRASEKGLSVFRVLIQPDFNKQCYIQYYILYLAISGTLWPNSTNSNDINFDKNQRRDYGERRRIPN